MRQAFLSHPYYPELGINPVLAGLLAIAVFAVGSAALNALLFLYALANWHPAAWFPLAVVTYILVIMLTGAGYGRVALTGGLRRKSAIIWATGACLVALYLLAVGFEFRLAIDWLFPPFGRDPELSVWRIVGVCFAALLFLIIAEVESGIATGEYGTHSRRRHRDTADEWIDRLHDAGEITGPDF